MTKKKESAIATEVDNIKRRFSEGFDPSEIEGNGDTALHTAVYKNADEKVLEARLYSKHENGYRCRNKPCLCGLEASQIVNKRGQLPKELKNITPDLLKILNEAGRTQNCLPFIYYYLELSMNLRMKETSKGFVKKKSAN